MKKPIGVLLVVLATGACAEANGTPGGGQGGSAGGGGNGGAGAQAGAGGDGAGAGGATGGAPSLAGLVINEIHPDEDWVELYNTMSDPIAIGGLALADDDMGVPKLAEGVTFAAGTEVDAGGYFVIGGKDACPADTNGAPCVTAAFGLSKDGDAVYLVDGAGTVLLTEPLPAMAVIVDVDSWGRFPNGTGSFQETGATAGDANELP
jgi:hypothetical protein